MSSWRLQAKNKRRLSVAEVLEPRVLYSADAIGGLFPLFLPEDSFDTAEVLVATTTNDSDITEFTGDVSEVVAIETDTKTQVGIKHVIFVDATIPESEQIIASVHDDSTSVIVIEAGEDGLLIISKVLSDHTDLDSVQIISHGSSGQLSLGSAELDHGAILKNKVAIERWGHALSKDGDILLLGCDIASDAQGVAFVELLSQTTQADVAASTNLTGHSTLGADWVLEYESGKVLSDHFINASIQQQWTFSLASITVDTLVDQFDIPLGTTLSELLTLQIAGEQVSLREAVYAASQGSASFDIVHLGAGTYQLSRNGNDDTGVRGDLDISDDIEIVGQGSADTIIKAAGGRERVFEVNSNDARFVGLQITDGNDDADGGGINAKAGTTITVVDSLLTGNHSDGNGGAIYSQGDVIVENSAISGNTADLGGAGIYVEGALTAADSTIFNNVAVLDGGGVHADSVALVRSQISGNFSGGKGGAVYVVADMTAENFSITDSRSVKDGGGVYSSGTFDFSNGEFSRNESTAENGGAIYSTKAGVVDAVQFNDGIAQKSGAAIFAEKTLSIQNSFFGGNTAQESGGAVFTEDELTISDTAFTGNSAGKNGGALHAHDEVTINRASFVSNTADTGSGGAIFSHKSGALNISNTTFSENSADSAGAIHAEEGGQINHSTFVGNTANSAASAIVSTGIGVDVKNSIFQDNQIAGDISSTVSLFVYTDGWNIFDFNAGGGFTGDMDNTQALLGGLTNTGNGVSVYPLLAGSPAINSGSIDPLVATDAWNRTHDEFPDIGAYEFDGNTSKAYWNDAEGNLFTSNLDFTNIQLVHLNVGNTPGSIAVDLDNSTVYWLESGNTAILSTIGDGSGAATAFLTGLLDATSIAVDSAAAHIYVAHAGATPRIDRYDLTTGLLLQSIVTTQIARPIDIEINIATGRIFWAEQGAGAVDASIRSTDLDGNDFIRHHGALDPISIAVNNAGDEVYSGGSAVGLDGIIRFYLDTGTSDIIFTAPSDGPGALAHDHSGDQLAWVSDDTNNIVLTNLSNSDISNYVHSDVLADLAITPTSLVTVRPVPTTLITLDVLEGDSKVISAANLTSTDSDSDPESIHYTISDGLEYGLLVVDGIPDQTTFTQKQINDGLVEYSHDSTESSSDYLELVVSDELENPQSFKLNISIAPDNDAPTLTAAVASVDVVEGGSYTLTTLDLVADDVDNTDVDYIYQLSTASTLSTLKVNGVLIGVGGTFTHTQLVTGQVVYQHNGGEDPIDTLAFFVSDGDKNSSTESLTFAIAPDNYAPTFSAANAAVDVLEGYTYTLTTLDLVADDVDNTDVDFVYHLSTASALSALEVNGVVIGVGGTFTHAQLLAGDVIYVHSGGEDSSDTLAFFVSDGDKNSSIESLAFTIAPDNDAPTLTAAVAAVDVLEGGSYTLTTLDLVAGDIDNTDVDFVYQLSTASTESTLKVNGVLIGVGGTFTHAQLLAGQVVYQHNGGEDPNDTLAFFVSDGDKNSSIESLLFAIAPDNDAPTLTAAVAAVDVVEGGSYTLTTLDLVAGDVDNTDADFVYQLSTASALSTLEVNGVMIDVGGTFTQTQLVAGEVIYLHKGGETNSDSLAFFVSDGNRHSATASLNFAIAPENDALILSIEVGAIEENVYGAVAGQVLVTDQDPGDTVFYSVDDSRFTVLDGKLTLLSAVSIDFETEPEIQLIVSATDSGGFVAREQITVTVLDRNDRPEVVENIVDESGDGFQLPLSTFVDRDGDQLRYSATLENGNSLPVWLAFDTEKRVFKVNNAALVVAELPVRIHADDGQGGQNSFSMILRFEPSIAAAEPVVFIEEVELDIDRNVIVAPTQNTVFVTAPIVGALPADEAAQSTKSALVKDELIKGTDDTAVDLQSLIQPLPVFNSLELAELISASGGANAPSVKNSLVLDVDSLDLSDLLTISRSENDSNLVEFLGSLDKHQELIDEQSNISQNIIGSSVGISSGLSVGYLLWLLRGGTLMGSVLSSLPAWRFVDPLPILGSLVEDNDGDDESLASMVNADSRAEPPKESEAEGIQNNRTVPFNGAAGE